MAIFIAPEPQYQPRKEDKGSLFAFVPLLARQKVIIANIIVAALLITVISAHFRIKLATVSKFFGQ